jgi:hypothetical protein
MVDWYLAGAAAFAGWVVLLTSSDAVALFRISEKRVSQLQNVVLLGSIVAAFGFGYLYAQERHSAPCPTRQAHRDVEPETVR